MQLFGASTLLCRDTSRRAYALKMRLSDRAGSGASVTRLLAQNGRPGEDLIEAFTAYERDMIEYGFAAALV
jgi:hypothetical protein